MPGYSSIVSQTEYAPDAAGKQGSRDRIGSNEAEKSELPHYVLECLYGGKVSFCLGALYLFGFSSLIILFKFSCFSSQFSFVG